MENKKHVVIYSHGFGVGKDDLGLLSDIAKSIPEVESILFDYNSVDDINKLLFVAPFSKQIFKLKSKINEVRGKYPNAIIDIIAHSQGSIITALAKPDGIRKILLMATPFDMSIDRTVNRYKNRTDCLLNLEGESKLYMLNGYFRIIPKEYWEERKGIKNVVKQINDLSKDSEVFIINANQDQLLGKAELLSFNEDIEIIPLDGNHNFENEARIPLIKKIKEILLNKS